MHYLQSREESAEILRRALQLMSSHQAGFHPVSYAVWYEHAADLNPGLTRDLDRLLASRAVLSDPDVSRLYAVHIAARDVEAFDLAQRQLRALLDDSAVSATGTQNAAEQFADALENAFKALAQPLDTRALKHLVGHLLSHAQNMHRVTCEFSQRLANNRSEVADAIERLERSQSEPLRDPLTGLNNRHGFQRAVAQSDLAGMALLAMDVDHFKRINDTHGHVIGDKVLVKIAEILRAHIKSDDIAARLGGDEFVVLLPNMPLAAAAALGEQMRMGVARIVISRPDGVEYVGQVSLCIGVAVGECAESLESLRHRADAALYRAKEAGRNRVGLAASGVPAEPGPQADQQTG